jgi:hypothetical protein
VQTEDLDELQKIRAGQLENTYSIERPEFPRLNLSQNLEKAQNEIAHPMIWRRQGRGTKIPRRC